jgi:toxin ParE1/3/4
MTLPLIVRREAEEDIQQAREFLEQARAGLGTRFVARLREVFERIESNPDLYGRVWKDVRAARVRRFRHLVYYTVFDDRVEILAVLHGARNPSTWRLRR